MSRRTPRFVMYTTDGDAARNRSTVDFSSGAGRRARRWAARRARAPAAAVRARVAPAGRCRRPPAASREAAIDRGDRASLILRRSIIPPGRRNAQWRPAHRMPPMDLSRALEEAMSAAVAAGGILRDDFHRPGGARGAVDKAEADTEAEKLIRAPLARGVPGLGATWARRRAARGGRRRRADLAGRSQRRHARLPGRPPGERGVDRPAGRWPSGAGRRVRVRRIPTTRATSSPGPRAAGPLRRNGRAVTAALPAALGPLDVVLVSSGGDRDPETNLRCAAPARYRCVPSIAHRLALVAAGEAAAATSLFAPCAWDYGAGQALLRAARRRAGGRDRRRGRPTTRLA